jgi:hypothetical protein
MGSAQQMLDAVRRGDAQTVAAHTSHLVTRVGVPVGSILRITQTAEAETAAMGMSIDSAELGQPSALYESEGTEVCFIPYRLEIHMPEHKGRALGFFIAVREGSEGEWSFVDGAPLRAHPEVLGTLLPGLPSSIELPENRNEFDN